MILLVHMLLGAIIASKISAPLCFVLAFLSHYFLDFFPHIEYPIENLKKNHWHKSMPDILRVSSDFCLGLLLISIFYNSMATSGELIILAGAFFAILPDGFTILNSALPNKILKIHDDFHRKKIHFLKDKKIPRFWRIVSQLAVIAISIAILKY